MPNISGIGISDWVEIFDIFASYNQFTIDDWIYLWDERNRGFQCVLWKNPFKLSFDNVYNFADVEGYYYATDPTKEGLPNGYRYIAYMFVGIAPQSLGDVINTSSSRPGYGTQKLYYPVNWDDIVSGFNQSGYSYSTSDMQVSCSTTYFYRMLGIGQTLQANLSQYSYDLNSQNFVSGNTNDILCIAYENVPQTFKDKMGITDELIGYTPEALEACLETPKPPRIANPNNPVCWFQRINNLQDITVNGTYYHPLKVVSDETGHRKFYYKDSRIILPNTGNISYNPFNVIVSRGYFVSNADDTYYQEDGSIAIIFQGVEPIV